MKQRYKSEAVAEKVEWVYQSDGQWVHSLATPLSMSKYYQPRYWIHVSVCT